MAISGRVCLLELRERVQRAQERTAAAQQQVGERRSKRKRKQAEAPRSEVPTFALTNDGQPPPPPVTSTNVMAWFRTGLRTLYGDRLEIPRDSEWWTIGDKKTAKRLLTQYGPELVEKGVEHFCATWPQRVEAADGRLGGIPGIGLLWKLRARIFAEVQGVIPQETPSPRRRRRNKNSDEYQPPAKPMDIGWE